MFFNDWFGIGRVALMAGLAYLALVGLVRASGKRTLAKMNAFDLVVTVALGSCLATIVLSRDVPLAEGVTALLTLIAMQYGMAWAAVRSQVVRKMLKSEPRLVFRHGRFLSDALRDERLTHGWAWAAKEA